VISDTWEGASLDVAEETELIAILGAISESGEGRRAGNVLIEPDKEVPSSRELPGRELTAMLRREFTNDASFDFLDAVDGGRSGSGFSCGRASSDKGIIGVVDDVRIEGTILDSRDTGLWRGDPSFKMFAKNR